MELKRRLGLDSRPGLNALKISEPKRHLLDRFRVRLRVYEVAILGVRVPMDLKNLAHVASIVSPETLYFCSVSIESKPGGRWILPMRRTTQIDCVYFKRGALEYGLG